MPTMAVGLILDGPQAEAILQAGDADLIAIGRQALFDPFWALHAAQDLGCDADFEMWTPGPDGKMVKMMEIAYSRKP